MKLFYLIRLYHDENTYLIKYGITNNLSRRYKEYGSSFIEQILTIKGPKASLLERMIKERVKLDGRPHLKYKTEYLIGTPENEDWIQSIINESLKFLKVEKC